jgi:uncharacterized protein
MRVQGRKLSGSWRAGGLRMCPALVLVLSCAAPASTRPLLAPESPASAVTAPAAVPPAASSADEAKPVQSPTGSAAHAKRDALLHRACTLGSALACNDLGLAEEGGGDARPWFERACELKLTRGCTNLALVLEDDASAGARVDELLSRSCDEDDAVACDKLGDAAYSGVGQAKNDSRAARAYDKACQLGRISGCVASGWLLVSGDGVAKNMLRARELFDFACQHDDAHGCAGVGASLVQSPTNQQELLRGVELSRKACSADIGIGCYWAALGHAQQRGSPDADARALMTRACELKVSAACELLNGGDEETGED